MDGYTDIGFRVMGSERRKKTRVSQDRTAGKKKKEKTNGGRRVRNDNAKLRDRSGKGEPRAGLLRESLLDKSVRKWNGEPRSGKISTFVEARLVGADLKKERSTTSFENSSLSRNLDRRSRLWKFGTATMEIAEGCYESVKRDLSWKMSTFFLLRLNP